MLNLSGVLVISVCCLETTYLSKVYFQSDKFPSKEPSCKPSWKIFLDILSERKLYSKCKPQILDLFVFVFHNNRLRFLSNLWTTAKCLHFQNHQWDEKRWKGYWFYLEGWQKRILIDLSNLTMHEWRRWLYTKTPVTQWY